jgi:hypothetical protein
MPAAACRAVMRCHALRRLHALQGSRCCLGDTTLRAAGLLGSACIHTRR